VNGVTHTYYYHCGLRIAMREGNTLYWLLTDHLGSTSMIVAATDSLTGELRYEAYGQTRDGSGITYTTKYRFTGQREEGAIGLYFYNARWYDPALGRFAQADTIVPDAGNPQALNRYSYVRNNPLRYVDRTGHYTYEDDPRESSHFWDALVRSRYPWTHPNYAQKTIGDRELLSTAAVVVGAAPALALGPVIIETGVGLLETVLGWALSHPLEATFIKAVAEEGFEAGATGTPFSPRNVALDLLTQVGDDLTPRAGMQVYRVWGSDPDDPYMPGAGPWGRSWTPVDPSTVPSYRDAAGLPGGAASGAYNTGRFVSVGVINDASGIQARTALSLDGQPGGLTEFVIPCPMTQITLLGVYGLNPPY